MTYTSWQYILCHSDTCSNHSAISDLATSSPLNWMADWKIITARAVHNDIMRGQGRSNERSNKMSVSSNCTDICSHWKFSTPAVLHMWPLVRYWSYSFHSIITPHATTNPPTPSTPPPNKNHSHTHTHNTLIVQGVQSWRKWKDHMGVMPVSRGAVRSTVSSLYAAIRMVVGSRPVLVMVWERHVGLALLCGCSGALEYPTTNSLLFIIYQRYRNINIWLYVANKPNCNMVCIGRSMNSTQMCECRSIMIRSKASTLTLRFS